MAFDIPKNNYSGKIREITLGTGDKAVTVGGANSYPFYLFEGDMLLRKLSLDKDQEVSFLAGKILVEIKEGKIRVKKSDCLHSLCMNMGWVEHPGQTVFCLPNKFSLEIKTQDHFNLDSVVF